MPELGDNAIYKITKWIRLIETLKFPIQSQPLLGSTTSSVTTVYGGQNINSVPDSAGFTVDVRTVPAHDHGRLVDDVQKICGDEATIEVVTDFPGFATDSDDPNIERLMDILATRPQATGAPYFTDASALVPGLTTWRRSSSGPARPPSAIRPMNLVISRISTRLSISMVR
jgi:succinyl-diaminopimelate desuccinylase